MAVSNEGDNAIRCLKKEHLAEAASSKEMKDITNTRILASNIPAASEVPDLADPGYCKSSKPAPVHENNQEVESESHKNLKPSECSPEVLHMINKTSGKPPLNGTKKLGKAEPSQTVELEEEQLMEMSGSYSEILGKPLVMNIGEELHAHGPSESPTSAHSLQYFTYSAAHSTQPESITAKVNASSSPPTKREINSGFIYKPPKLSPCNSCSSARETLLRQGKVSKPSSLPQLVCNTANGAASGISTGPYYQYYCTTSSEQAQNECDLLTPVQDGEDAVQALLSHHRLAAYLASPDRPATPPSLPPSSEGPSKPLTVGQCGRELAEAALESVGTVTRLPNNAVAFVADDLHEKIRMASPASLCSGASTPVVQGSERCSVVSPRPPPLNPALLNDIERHARHLATNVDSLIESLTEALHGISALTVDCVETYRDTVCKTCDAVDANIKSMYQLMAKGEELSKAMKPAYALHSQIKDVRRTLDQLESEMHSSSS